MTGCIPGQGDGTRSTEEPAGLLPLSSSCLFSAARLASPHLSSDPLCLARKRENSELFRHCFLCLCLFLLLLTLTLAVPLNFTAFFLVS